MEFHPTDKFDDSPTHKAPPIRERCTVADVFQIGLFCGVNGGENSKAMPLNNSQLASMTK